MYNLYDTYLLFKILNADCSIVTHTGFKVQTILMQKL